MKKSFFVIINFSLLIINWFDGSAQLKWINVDSLYQPLPRSVHVYFTNEPIDTASFRAFYLIADLKDKKLDFTVDTTLNRRLTPTKFYEKDNHPLVVMNCSFFSFETNRNVNVIIKDGKLVAYNPEYVITKYKKDTAAKLVPHRSAIGITKKRIPDIAWVYTDSSKQYFHATQLPRKPHYRYQDFFEQSDLLNYDSIKQYLGNEKDLINNEDDWRKKIRTAIGGGPVLLQKGKIFITNEEEMMFRGKAIRDKHPRTGMGYTKDSKLIILMIEGRNKNAGGATLTQGAQIFKDLGCREALNLDGGGSSCLLINGKETIKPSDAAGQRAIPAVFIIKQKTKN